MNIWKHVVIWRESVICTDVGVLSKVYLCIGQGVVSVHGELEERTKLDTCVFIHLSDTFYTPNRSTHDAGHQEWKEMAK